MGQQDKCIPPSTGCHTGVEDLTDACTYNFAITMQGMTARSRFAELLKISDFRHAIEDAALMQKMSLQLARVAARTRAKLKKEMQTVVQGTEGLILLGMGV